MDANLAATPQKDIIDNKVEVPQQADPSLPKTSKADLPHPLERGTATLHQGDTRQHSALSPMQEAELVHTEPERTSLDSKAGIVSLSYMMSVWDKESNEHVRHLPEGSNPPTLTTQPVLLEFVQASGCRINYLSSDSSS